MASNDESSNIILPESIALEWSFETETENIEPIHHNIIGFVAPTIPNEQRAEIVVSIRYQNFKYIKVYV